MATIDSTLTAERVNKAGYVRDKVIPELEARGYKDGKDFHTKGSKRTSAPKLKLMLIDDIKKRSLQHVGRQGQNTLRLEAKPPPPSMHPMSIPTVVGLQTAGVTTSRNTLISIQPWSGGTKAGIITVDAL